MKNSNKSNKTNLGLVKSLSKIMEKANPFQRAIVSIGILVDILVISYIGISIYQKIEINFLIVVIGLIDLILLASIIAIVHASEIPISKTLGNKGGVINMNTEDCLSIQKQLTLAEEVLNRLQEQAAFYTPATLPVDLQINIGHQTRKIEELKKKLSDCQGGEK